MRCRASGLFRAVVISYGEDESGTTPWINTQFIKSVLDRYILLIKSLNHTVSDIKEL